MNYIGPNHKPSGYDEKARLLIAEVRWSSWYRANQHNGATVHVRCYRWSQPVAATLYPDRERWSVWRCDKDTFGGSLRQRRPSFGIAGSVARRSRQLGEHLVRRPRD